MAVDIFNPPQGGPWGPGIPYQVRDLAPTIATPGGGQWQIMAVDLTLVDTPILRQVHRFEGASPPPVAGLVGDLNVEHTYLPSLRTLTLSGAPVELVARVLDSTGSTILGESRRPMVWDPSYAWMLPSSAVQGGFTPADRVTLNSVVGAVTKVLPAALPGGAQLAMSVIDLVRGPPRSLLQPFGSQLLSGRGTISAQPPNALHSFGGTWSIFTIPAGYGKDDGALVEWHRRIGQFVVIREGAGQNSYVDVLEDSHNEGTFILWQFPNPTEIQYDIAPGVELLWRWLV